MSCVNVSMALYSRRRRLRDAKGRVLIDAGGYADPEATLPRIPIESQDDDTGEHVEVDREPVPPTPTRLARRALALTAVAARATLELDAPHLDSPESERQYLLEWIESLGLGDELEPNEWRVLQRPVGKLEQQDHINAMWRVEGLAVLAWALNRHELPPDDELVVPGDLYQAMGILDVDSCRELLRSAVVRPQQELSSMQTHLLMLHWRLRNYWLRPGPMDFVAFSKSCWVGSFDISSFQIADNDLAIGGIAIDDAHDDKRSMVNSLASERHLAANWLMGHSEIYSETDTST